MNRCYFCEGKLKKEKVNIARYWGKKLIALENVPALICQQCGERYFEAKVSAGIDAKIKLALDKKSRKEGIDKIAVPVLQF